VVKFVGGDLLRVVVRESQDAKRIGVTKNPRQKNYCNLNFGRFNSISISAERRNNISFAPAPGNLNQDFQFLAAAEEPIFLGGGAGYNVKTVLYNWLAASNHCSGAAHHIIYIYIYKYQYAPQWLLAASHAYTSMPHPLLSAREVCYIEKQVAK
jgi:hypothetical protein